MILMHWLADFMYGSFKYSNGWMNPSVVKGYFMNDSEGKSQHKFFLELLNLGFKRTRWQMVYPDQTAGLVKKLEFNKEQPNEYHVRFYKTGIIDCELEFDRFNLNHWTINKHSLDYLENILNENMTGLSLDEKKNIQKQFQPTYYSKNCIRGKHKLI